MQQNLSSDTIDSSKKVQKHLKKRMKKEVKEEPDLNLPKIERDRESLLLKLKGGVEYMS